MAPTWDVMGAVISIAYNIHTSTFTYADINVDDPVPCAVCDRVFITTYIDESAYEITIPYGDAANIPCIDIRKLTLCHICGGLCMQYPDVERLSGGSWDITTPARVKSRATNGLASLRFCRLLTITRGDRTINNKICACCRDIAWSYVCTRVCRDIPLGVSNDTSNSGANSITNDTISICDGCFNKSNRKLITIRTRAHLMHAVVLMMPVDVAPLLVDTIVDVGLV